MHTKRSSSNNLHQRENSSVDHPSGTQANTVATEAHRRSHRGQVVHNLGYIKVFDHTVLQAMQKLEAALERVDRNLYQLRFEFAQT